MAQQVTLPIGSVGAIVVSESAGIITAQFTAKLQQGAVNVNAGVSGNLGSLLAMAASAQSNATFKAILAEAGMLAAGLPT